jgi:hypothetical protein
MWGFGVCLIMLTPPDVHCNVKLVISNLVEDTLSLAKPIYIYIHREREMEGKYVKPSCLTRANRALAPN